MNGKQRVSYLAVMAAGYASIGAGFQATDWLLAFGGACLIVASLILRVIFIELE